MKKNHKRNFILISLFLLAHRLEFNFISQITRVTDIFIQPAMANKLVTEKEDIRDKWAICIGINRFNSPKLKPQKFAQKSSADVLRVFKDHEIGRFALDHVMLVNGVDANKAGIETAVKNWLCKKALPNDLVVIYLNTRVMQNSEGQIYFCANDTACENFETAINLSDFLSNIKKSTGSNYVLCLLDTSPALTEVDDSKTSNKLLLKNLALSSGVGIFSANEFGKTSYNDEQAMQTRFVHYLVEALKSGGGNFPTLLVAEYVWQKIKQDVQSAGAQEQTPSFNPASNDNKTANIPLGIVVKSSFQNKGISIGHPVDNLSMDRPDIVPPTVQRGKTVTIENRAVKKEVAKKEIVKNEDEEDQFDPNLDMSPYISKMKQDIIKHWKLPEDKRTLDKTKVIVMITISRDGSILNPSILEGSGNESIDNSALAALKLASPLEPLPKGAPSTIDIKYVFDWKSKMNTAVK